MSAIVNKADEAIKLALKEDQHVSSDTSFLLISKSGISEKECPRTAKLGPTETAHKSDDFDNKSTGCNSKQLNKFQERTFADQSNLHESEKSVFVESFNVIFIGLIFKV